MRRASAILTLALLAPAGCVHADDEPAPPPRGPIAIQPGRVTTSWVAQDRLYRDGKPGPLAAAVNSTLIGNLAPVAALDRSGRTLAYTSWRSRRPVLRLRDLATGADRVLAAGAYSGVWRHDGALAYFEAAVPAVRIVRRYVGHIVVRRRPTSPPVRWTRSPGRYVVAAWAGDRLLAYGLRPGWPDLLVLDGPGRARVLGRSTALVAVSPDGRHALVTRYGSTPPLVRVVSVVDGIERSRLRVRRLRWIVEAGSWEADRAVAATNAGLGLFRVSDRTLELEDVFQLDPSVVETGVFEPRLDASGERVAAWIDLHSAPRQAFPGAAVVECDLAERSCTSGPRVSSVPGVRLVYDPSRP
jgi:hypothetical protein